MADPARRIPVFVAVLFTGVLLLLGSDASAASACGGLNQRGCCVTEGRYDWSNPGNGACAPPYIEVGGCSGSCLCGGWNWFGVSSSSHCVAPPVHCGYNGERACCVTEPRWTTSNPLDAGCAPGLVEAWGCSGNCLCGGANPFDFNSITNCVPCGSRAGVRACGGVGGIGGTCATGLTEVGGICTPCGREGQVVCGGTMGVGGQCDAGFRASFGICHALPRAAEPWCNCSYITQTGAPDAPVKGFADLHAHQFANLGFGGLVIWGEPYHPLGVNEALRRCDYAYRLNVVDRWGWQVPAFFDQGKPVHGAWGLGDLIGQNTNPLGIGATLTHGTEGQASFSGWPLWHQTTHQKMYYRWLERAFRGGLKLMVMMTVTNEVFCRGVNRQAGFGCNDMAAVDKQIQAARSLEASIDAQYGGAGRGWYRIVTTPQAARAAINAGKMAVVLGIEVDSLFGCKPGYCSIDYVRNELARYKAMGVRHLFPVHLFNNAFAGPSVYNSKFNVGNRVATGEYFDVRECSNEGYGFRFQPDVADAFLGFLFFGVEPAPLYGGTAHCNTRGLTPLGDQFMRELMRQKMIIDIDHMSALAVEDSLSLAEQFNYPLVVGHAGFFDIKNGPASEFDRTAGQLRRIRDLGGMVASGIWHTKESVASDCPSSSKSFAAAYRYAVEQMKDSPLGPGVAFGTDINGMVAQPAPRFGADACAREPHAAQASPVSYPFYYNFAGPAWFGKSVTGGRTFDINTEGVAHIGMLPDFIQDLRNVGVTDAELGPLFSSAEAYIRMWERIEATTVSTPISSVRVPPTFLSLTDR